MKKLLLTAALLVAGFGVANATDFKFVGVSSNVVVSTQAWTAVPTTPDPNRKGLLIDNYATNTGSMLYVFTQDGATPTVPITQGAAIAPADEPLILSIGRKVYLWAVSLHTAPESIFYQELK